MKTLKHLAITIGCLIGLSQSASAQNEIYPQHFNLNEVTLLDSPLKEAMNRNIQHLLQYDVDRLLTPYVRQAGLGTKQGTYYQWESKHPNFQNWGSGNFRLDGHVGGHYMTALALAYAATDDQTLRTSIKERVAHILQVLADCQAAYDNNTNGLYGFIGGQPCNDAWISTYKGTVGNFGNSAVPLYCQHKILAGLRDIYLYVDGAESESAKLIYKKLCDWHLNLVSKLSDSALQSWLNTEHGGVNETLADAYRIFGEAKYLAGAKRYSHQYEINGMQTVAKTFLDNQHANTQVPKFIGFARIAQEDANMKTYMNAAKNFWTDVATNRTVNIGGNSVGEHFLSVAASNRYIDELDGPESCNTNNMLKLSEILFDSEHDSKYADFYEAGMYNHILSTQDPTTGGYVYFTPLRPQSYRIYSVPNQDMWCCVGTGMENHSKYAHFIYTKQEGTLFVNLFTASKLNDDTYALTQQTQFPYEQASTITIDKAGTFTLAIRKPHWVTKDFDILVNGAAADVSAMQNGYMLIKRSWNAGDKIEVKLPMELRYEECPNMKDYIAFKYGPILLAARTSAIAEGDDTGLGYEPLTHEYALGERMGHAPGSYTQKKSLASMPMLIGDRADVMKRLTVVDPATLTFSLDVSRNDELANNYSWTSLTLTPYYSIHHSRLSNYFYQNTIEGYKNSDWAKEEQKNMALEERTINSINMGEQQQEAGAVTYDASSTRGNYKDESYRDAQAGGWIQIELDNDELTSTNLSLMLRFTTADKGRKCDILVNGSHLTTYTVPATYLGTNDNGFYNVEIPLGDLALKDGKPAKKVTVRLEANHNTLMPGLYFIRLLKDGPELYQFHAQDYRVADGARATGITVDEAANTFTVQGKAGKNNICFGMKTDLAKDYYVTSDRHYFVVRGTGLNITDASTSFVWWFNGYNNSASVAPNMSKEADGEQILAWDINKNPGMNGHFDTTNLIIPISTYGNQWIDAIGLTSAQADNAATIRYVGYMTEEEVEAIFPKEDIGEDVTGQYIKNPSFEADNAKVTGRAPKDWSFTSDQAMGWIGVNPKGSDDLATDGNYIFGIWCASNVNAKLFQDVQLPQGKYTLTADMMVTYAARLSKQCIFAGNNRGYYNYETNEEGCFNNNMPMQEIEAAPYQTIKIDFEVTADNATVQIGAASSPIAGRNNTWFKIDNFRLYRHTATGISGIQAPTPSSAAIYNISGQRLNDMQRGINIVAGKKIVK